MNGSTGSWGGDWHKRIINQLCFISVHHKKNGFNGLCVNNGKKRHKIRYKIAIIYAWENAKVILMDRIVLPSHC